MPAQKSPPSPQTRDKAIKWIAKMKWLINQTISARQLSALEKQNLTILKASQLLPGHVIRSNQGKRYTVTDVRPHSSGNVLAISAHSVVRKHTFYYDPNRDVRVEVG